MGLSSSSQAPPLEIIAPPLYVYAPLDAYKRKHIKGENPPNTRVRPGYYGK
jgi:hypothetical protein